MDELERLGVLLGRWSWEGAAPDGSFEVSGWAEYEWLPGRHFLLERSELTAAGRTNTSLAVTGRDPEGGPACLARYFDSEGISGSFRIAVEGDLLAIDWDRYRCRARIAADGNSIAGPWESSADGLSWGHWYEMRMTRISAGA